MTINYQLDEKDFLTYQLYIASKSDRIRKKRLKSKIIIPIIYAAITLFNIYKKDFIGALIFLALAFLWFIFYPIWEKRHYINHYKGFITENYKDRLNRIANLEFTNEYILAKDSGSETKISTNEIEEINEIATIIFIKLKTGASLILSKNKIENIDILKTNLKELAHNLDIKYNNDENWVWK